VPIELRVPGIWWGDAVSQIVSAHGIPTPEKVSSVGKIDTGLPARDVQAVLFERPDKRHLDVKVVLVKLIDHFGRPGRDPTLRD